jgi:hypothetical protein
MYSITKLGAVWSHAKSTGVSRHGGQWIKPWNNQGYLALSLVAADGSSSSKYVHRLVAAAWVANPSPERLKFVNHKDGNRGNPRFDNLEWCDRSHNLKHAWASGARGDPMASKAAQRMREKWAQRRAVQTNERSA